MDRRSFVESAVRALLLNAIAPAHAWAGGHPRDMSQWVREAVGAKEDLRAGRIDVLAWQARIEGLNRSVSLPDLTAYLDIEALTRNFAYDSSLAETADPVLPEALLGEAGMKRWFVRVFGLRRGGVVIPHVHNNMVSAHLVLSGSFHARTHDRVRDLPDAVVLRPTRNGMIGAGDVISMSDRRDNQHWLLAKANRSTTLDVGVVGLPPSWPYGLTANEYNMIYVDPTGPVDRSGLVVAPRLSFEAAVTKFAP